MDALLADLDDNGKQMRVDDDDDLPSDAEQEALPRHFFDDDSDEDNDLNLEDLAGQASAAASTDANTDEEEDGESFACPATTPLHLHYGELAVELPKPKRQVVDQVTGRMLGVISAAAMCSEHAKQSSDRLVRVRQMKGKCVKE
jgi:hypothetical protein